MSIESTIENKLKSDLEDEQEELPIISCDGCKLSFMCVGLNKFKGATNFFNDRLIDSDKAIEINSRLKRLLGSVCRHKLDSKILQTTILDFK